MSGLLVLTLLIPGCSDSNRPMPDAERNLQALSVFFGRYVRQNRGQSPPDEAEFKKFIASRPTTEFESFGFDPSSVDKMFISPRDNEPYQIAWKAPVGPPGPDGQAAMVIWEKTGSGGKRYVANALGKIELIDEAAFQERRAATSNSK